MIHKKALHHEDFSSDCMILDDHQKGEFRFWNNLFFFVFFVVQMRNI